MYLTNLHPDPNLYRKKDVWWATAKQDAAGCWTYSFETGKTSCTLFLWGVLGTPTSGTVEYVAVIGASTDLSGTRIIAVNNDKETTGTELKRTMNVIVTRIALPAGYNLALRVTGTTSVRPTRACLFTPDDWTALQQLGLNSFTGDTMPLGGRGMV